MSIKRIHHHRSTYSKAITTIMIPANPPAKSTTLSLPSLCAPLSCVSPTLTPKLVAVTTAPTVFVVVIVVVAVVLAVHAVQLVHGAFVVHGPLVQPLHAESGQPLPPHQAVQGPVVHGPDVQPPQLPPKGPPTPGPGPGPLDHAPLDQAPLLQGPEPL